MRGIFKYIRRVNWDGVGPDWDDPTCGPTLIVIWVPAPPVVMAAMLVIPIIWRPTLWTETRQVRSRVMLGRVGMCEIEGLGSRRRVIGADWWDMGTTPPDPTSRSLLDQILKLGYVGKKLYHSGSGGSRHCCYQCATWILTIRSYYNVNPYEWQE